MQNKIENIWSALLSTKMIDDSVVLDCRKSAGCFPGVAEKWKGAEVEQRKLAMSRFIEVGGQWQEALGEESARFGPYLIEENLISVLVESLKDQEPTLRHTASRILAYKVPDTLIRNHSRQVESAVLADPEMNGSSLLLGKLGSENALRMLQGFRDFQSGKSRDIRASRGKLGDIQSETGLIEEYRNEKDPRIKKAYAWYLGYMAKPKSLGVLAVDLRTGFEYAWNQKAKRSFRIHVIEALSIAYPTEPRLWSPSSSPSGDSYYDGVESWSAQTLGARWVDPRPPFLYEEEVPMAKPSPIR